MISVFLLYYFRIVFAMNLDNSKNGDGYRKQGPLASQMSGVLLASKTCTPWSLEEAPFRGRS